MRRIIQKYNEGSPGAVGPAVATGIPQGGHAAAAIQSYLSGQTAGPLSYTAGQSTVPDYRALAAIEKERRLSEWVAKTPTVNAASGASDDSGDLLDDMMAAAQNSTSSVPSSGYTSTNPSDVSYTGNTPGQMSNTSYTPTGFISGGGKDGKGNLGAVGDFFGGIGDALGITNYNGQGTGPLSGLNMSGPNTASPNPNQAAADAHAATQSSSSGGEKREQARLNAVSAQVNSLKRQGLFDLARTTAMEGGISYDNLNNGGPIGPRVQTYNDGSAGGVAVAKSGLREDEIRQRQLMQARMPEVKASPLSGIGESLMTGAINNGVSTGLATMAGKEGLAGTLGTMMGSGGVGATAATGGLGAGMMATLGPIGIGLGLGKLFGLFNDGGKVPCSCGKTSCKCAKEMKSPLSGE